MNLSNKLISISLLFFGVISLISLIFYFFSFENILKEEEKMKNSFFKNINLNSIFFFNKLIDILKSLPRIFLSIILCNFSLYIFNKVFGNELYSFKRKVVSSYDQKVTILVRDEFGMNAHYEDRIEKVLEIHDSIMDWREFYIYDLKGAFRLKFFEEIFQLFVSKIFAKPVALIFTLYFLQKNR